MFSQKKKKKFFKKIDKAFDNEKFQLLKDVNKNTLFLIKPNLSYNHKEILNCGKKDKKKEMMLTISKLK